MQKNIILITGLIFGLFSQTAFGQAPGDTITVQSFSYKSGTRDSTVQFPVNSNISFEKVIMEYSMRCKNAQVSTTANRNLGCGEWDYSCNTYLHDSAHVDSLEKTFPSHLISGFTGTSFDYTSQPTFDFHQSLQKSVTVNNIVSETASTIGVGTLNLSNVLPTDTHSAKSQFLFTQTELSAAGLIAGDIDALSLFLNSNPGPARFLRLKIKHSTKTVLNGVSPDLSGFTEVYFNNTPLANGANRIQFYTPFNWDGVSNIIVETSFTNRANGNALNFAATAGGSGLVSKGDYNFDFNGSNYIEAQNYKGIQGNGARTVETWINTYNTTNAEEIISWGSNLTGQKWLVRLNAVGRIRVEVNGGNSIGTTVVNDGLWHHIAVTSDGINATNIKIYVDGQLETVSASQSQAMNTTSGTNLRITRGHHNRYFIGKISDVRIWNVELNSQEIQNWMHRKLNSSHPKYINLEAYYPLADGSGLQINDQSGNGHHANVINGANWSQVTGDDHFKYLELLVDRPNLTFYQGSYNLSIVNDTVIDSVMRPVHIVDQYAVFSKSGTVESDSLGIINTNNYWEASPQNIYDPNGALLGTVPVASMGTVNITDLPYFDRAPSKFEIMSFVTPYGINVDFGQDGETWFFDLTDFLPILKGNKRISIERGGQWQEELDIKFHLIVGTPPRDILDIQQIWKVEKKSFANIDSDQSYEPRQVLMNALGTSFKIRTAITGHGQDGEFIPRNHWVNIGGGTPEFNWQVWTECALNPVFPQGGTWIYDRAGWCPGMPTDIQEWDITPYVSSGQAVEIDYGLATATGTSDYIVNHQLVSYGAANHSLDAKLKEIISPNDYVEFGRTGRICEGVEVIIQNTGGTTLTSLEIDYWVNNSSSPETYTWNGSLEIMEQENILLPSNSKLWSSLKASNNIVHAAVRSPNGGSDEYALNNTKSSAFEIPEIIPDEFYIYFRTNSAAAQNSYQITDEFGTVVFSKSNFSNNQFNNDTVRLPFGCYTFQLNDAGDNGISFWANSEGTGSLAFRRLNGANLKQFNGDFGKSIVFPFTVNSALSNSENKLFDLSLHPNPAQDQFSITMEEIDKAEIMAFNSIGQQMVLNGRTYENEVVYNTRNWKKGVYLIHITKGGKKIVKKLLVL